MPRIRKTFRKNINHNENVVKLKAKLGQLLKAKSSQGKKQQKVIHADKSSLSASGMSTPYVIKRSLQNDVESFRASTKGKKRSSPSENDDLIDQIQVDVAPNKRMKMSPKSPEVSISNFINEEQFESEENSEEDESQRSLESYAHVLNSSHENSEDYDESNELFYNDIHSEHWEGETTCTSSDSVNYEEESNTDNDYIPYDDVENSESEFNSSEESLANEFYHNIVYNDVHDSSSDSNKIEEEDIIIHKGLAQKRDLQNDDNVSFDSDVEEAQIIELRSVQVKTIEQPKAYEKDELKKLNIKITNYNNMKIPLQSAKEKLLELNSAISSVCPKLVSILDNTESSKDEAEENWESEVENDFCDDSVTPAEKYQIYLNKSSTSCDDHETTQQEERALHNRSQVLVLNIKNNLPQIDVHTPKLLNELKPSQINNLAYSILEQVSDVMSDENEAGECNILTASIIDESIIETEEDFKECENQSEQIAGDVASDAIIFEEDGTVLPPNIMFNELSSSSQLKHDTNSLNYNRNLFCNAINDYEVLVLVREPFHIYGTVRLTVVLGAPQIYGYNPKVNEEVEIFSLRGCTTIEINVSFNSGNNINNKGEQSPLDLKNTLKKIFKKYRNRYVERHLKNLLNSFQPQTDAIIMLSRNVARKRLQQQFHKCMDQNVFPNIKNLNIGRPLYDTEYRLRCIINTSVTDAKSLKIPIQWQHFTLNDKSKVLVAGGKAVGKSTLLRYLANKCLSKYKSVLYIDLDIGQPEIFVPQTISCYLLQQPLIGPGFMLNLQPDKSFAVGHTNIIMCPQRYVLAVKELINFCNNQLVYQNIPWLINTMGYNKGFGLELLSVITDDLNFTDLIQIQSTKEINNYDCLLHPSTLFNVTRQMFPNIVQSNVDNEKKVNKRSEYSLHVWQSVANDELSRHNKEWDMSSKDLRYANLLSRISSSLTDTLEWITDCKPLKTRLSDLKLINLQDVNYKEQQLIRAFEANLIYLCHYKNTDVPLECFGIGILRAIDYTLKEVYLVPSIPLESLVHVNCLAIGEMPLPTSLFINQGSKILNTAPFVYNTLDAKTSKAIKHFCRRYDNDTLSPDNKNRIA